MPVNNTIVRGTITPIKKNILIYDMNFGERTTKAGLILMGDDGKQRGIRPRWGKVLAVGPEQDSVEPGQWVLVAHGRWSRGIQYEVDGNMQEVRMADPDDILGVQDDVPDDAYVASTDTATAY